MTRLVIFGGAGFLGSQVSRAALSKGWQVTCVSRSGCPENRTSWHDKVEWVKGDAFTPASYAQSLSSAKHVVTTIGVLDHRGFMKEKRPSRVLDKVAHTLRDSINDFLPFGSPDYEALRTYDMLNRDAAIAIATEATKHSNIESLVYVSAADRFPGIPQRYITSKREAEEHLTIMERKFRSILFRPGFMFSDERGFTKPVARLLGLSYALNSSLSGGLPFIGAAGVKPLAVDRVGSAIVEACADERIEGPVEIHQIEALADVRWRAEMIV